MAWGVHPPALLLGVIYDPCSERGFISLEE